MVAELAHQHQIGLIALVECTVAPRAIINALDAVGMEGFVHPRSPSGVEGDISIFIRVPGSSIQHVYDDPNNHVTIRRLIVQNCSDLLLVVAHSQSKRNWSDKDQIQ